jgi:nucleoside-diphosphate-sugar epimerase
MAFNRLISCALRGRPFAIYGDGEQTRDFTYVDDAVAGTIATAERGRAGGVYNIGGGSRRSLNDVLGVLRAMTDTPVEAKYVDRERGDVRDTAADISLARRELGFEPNCDFGAGLLTQFEWQRALLSGRSDPPERLYDCVG